MHSIATDAAAAAKAAGDALVICSAVAGRQKQ